MWLDLTMKKREIKMKIFIKNHKYLNVIHIVDAYICEKVNKTAIL